MNPARNDKKIVAARVEDLAGMDGGTRGEKDKGKGTQSFNYMNY